ncbi:MAG: response regulator [Caulobacteraceae bacterium]|nr:response regulator [Caulobacteraceae bacterium]
MRSAHTMPPHDDAAPTRRASEGLDPPFDSGRGFTNRLEEPASFAPAQATAPAPATRFKLPGFIAVPSVASAAQPNSASLSVDHLTRRDQAVRDLLEAAEDAIDESRAGGDRRFWDECAFDPSALLEDVLTVVRPRARAAGVSVARRPNLGVLSRVVGDPTRLRRILLKLLGGAVKSHQTGEVVVTLRGAQQDHQLSLDIIVSISGAGGAHGAARGGAASGIARERWVDSELSFGISEDLGRALDGEVADSEGAPFDLAVVARLRLPVARVEAAFSHAPRPTKLEDGALEGLRILLVEDMDLNRELIRMLLAPFGCEVDEAVNGWAALEAIEAHDYDAVLMDMNMPEMDGFEAIRRIRARDDARARVPILAVTGRALAVDIAKIRTLGANGHLSKPFVTEDLVGAIVNCLGPAGG